MSTIFDLELAPYHPLLRLVNADLIKGGKDSQVIPTRLNDPPAGSQNRMGGQLQEGSLTKKY